jgi:hypothetical protein
MLHWRNGTRPGSGTPLRKCEPPYLIATRSDEHTVIAESPHAWSLAGLEKAIAVYEQVTQCQLPSDERRVEALSNLGYILFCFCRDHRTNQARARRCEELLREALLLRPSGHPLRGHSLHMLARALLFLGYQQQSTGWGALAESVALHHEALLLCPEGHPGRADVLDTLAFALIKSFEHCGDLKMLEEAIDMLRQALRHPVHSHRDWLSHSGSASSIWAGLKHW